MRPFLVFIILFTLTLGLLVSIDLFQGASYKDLLSYILVSKTELVGEDYVLIFLFTVPFAITKIVLKHLKTQKKKRNQQQNDVKTSS